MKLLTLCHRSYWVELLIIESVTVINHSRGYLNPRGDQNLINERSYLLRLDHVVFCTSQHVFATDILDRIHLRSPNQPLDAFYLHIIHPCTNSTNRSIERINRQNFDYKYHRPSRNCSTVSYNLDWGWNLLVHEDFGDLFTDPIFWVEHIVLDDAVVYLHCVLFKYSGQLCDLLPTWSRADALVAPTSWSFVASRASSRTPGSSWGAGRRRDIGDKRLSSSNKGYMLSLPGEVYGLKEGDATTPMRARVTYQLWNYLAVDQGELTDLPS
jgi:hypothetical protein